MPYKKGELPHGGHGKDPRTLETRFREFEGVGQKKGSMAVNILVRDYGIAITGTFPPAKIVFLPNGID